jgi:WD40 repeat protein/serine/threonine protein kinase
MAMPAPASIDEFLELGLKSGLLDQGNLDAWRTSEGATAATTPKACADALIEGGLLTPFQAEHLLAGKWRGFVIAGKYRLMQRVGAGGMGSVYLCEHVLMKRRVALKVLPASHAEDKAALDRFYREARAVAALDHPNIVRAHDIDREDKLHFLVMEYVDGSSMQDIVKRFGPMDATRAAHYIAQAACGLQHAHEAGIVHRDIKPGNLLVDRTGTVKILDMGLARFFHDDRDELTKQYDKSSVLGTADYLAPEQALDSHAVDIRADIYSLGATLYYLLSGQSPFQDGTVTQKLIWHQVREPKPIGDVRRDVPAELSAVMKQMMAKKPEDRYQTPLEVVDALAAFTQTAIAPPPPEEMPYDNRGGMADASRSVAGARGIRTLRPAGNGGPRTRDGGSGRTDTEFPVEGDSTVPGRTPRRGRVGSNSRIQRFNDADAFTSTALAGRWLPPDVAHRRRQRVWVLIAATCVMTLLGYGGVLIWAVTRHTAARPPDHGTQQPAQQKPLPALLAEQPVGLLRTFEGHTAAVAGVAFGPDGKFAVTASLDGSGRLFDLNNGKSFRTLGGHTDKVNALAFPPSGVALLTASSDKTVRQWNLSSGADVHRFTRHDCPVLALACSPDGKRVASAGEDGVVILWELGTGTELLRFKGHTGPVRAVAFAPDGQRLLTGGADKTVRLWNCDSGGEIRQLDGHTGEVLAVAFAADGIHAASGGADKQILVWDTDQGKAVLKVAGHAGAVAALAFTPDGRYLVSASDDQTVRLWESATGYELHRFVGHSQGVTSLAVSADGRLLLSGCKDGTARLWGLPRFAQGAPLGEPTHLLSHDKSAERVAFSPDGRLVASAGSDGVVRLCNLETGEQIRRFNYNGAKEMVFVSFSHDGRLVLAANKDQTARLWETETAKSVKVFKGHQRALWVAIFSPDDRQVVTAGGDSNKDVDRAARLWDVDSGKEIRTFVGHTNTINSAAWIGNTRRFATASWDKTVRIWDADSGETIHQIKGHTAAIATVACSPDGKLLLTGCQDGTLRLFDADSGMLVGNLASHPDSVWAVAFSPCGRFALSAGPRRDENKKDLKEGLVRLWDVGSRRLLYEWPSSLFGGAVAGIAFHPDGTRFVTACHDKTVRLWNLPSFTACLPVGEIRAYKGHGNAVTGLAVSADGKRLLSGGQDHTVRLWHTALGQELRRFSDHSAPIGSVAFSTDGRLALSASADKSLRIWDAETGLPMRVLTGHKQKVNAAVFAPDAKRIFSGGDDGALVFDADTGKLLRACKDSGAVLALVVSPDGKQGLTGGADNTVRLWNLDTGAEVRRFPGHTAPVRCVALSWDGRFALSGSDDKTVRLWDMEKGTLLDTFTMLEPVSAVAFSPEGKRFLTGGADGAVRWWDALAHKPLHHFDNHGSAVTRVAFLPGGRQFVSGGADGTVRLWGLPPVEPPR